MPTFSSSCSPASDREGLPDSIRFWKTRIESTDPDATFRVGLIYGPSGCGKSSLVKAGLLPRLGKHVMPVYIEATPQDTEARLHKGLRKFCPDLPADGNLVDALASLRRGRLTRPGEKVLLIIDQFEQWLFTRRDESNTELVAALRQCDGEHVQAVVMVRDDFWMAATRFMRDLEIRLVEGENSAAVDLFDLLHARRVLTAFGRAYGVLPEKTSDFTTEQKAFLEQSVAGLAQDGKVISVRLALFAEMVKGKPWTPAALRDVGGTQGVGVTFLDETFSASTAPPEHRLHQRAAQAVLKALLPQTGTDIKGQMRSEAELREASGYATRARDFDDLIGILDPEIRLITPTDPEGSGGEAEHSRPAGHRYYQLTHDYLVPSLRDWLTRKQRETRRGRAELRMAERAPLWATKPENRYLPSVPEWMSIRALTRSQDWTEPQRRMMRRAGRVLGLRALGLAAVAVVLTAIGLNIRNRVLESTADGLVERLLAVDASGVPDVVKDIEKYRRWTDPELKKLVAQSSADPKKKLHASLALLPVDPAQVEYLKTRLQGASQGELSVLRDSLFGYRSRLSPELWSALELARADDPQLLTIAGFLAGFDPDNPSSSESGAKVAQSFVKLNPVALGYWLAALRPLRRSLTGPLASIFREKARPDAERTIATIILAEYAGDNPDLLANLLMDADPKAFPPMFQAARPHAEKVAPILQAEFSKTAPDVGKDAARAEAAKEGLAERQTRAAVALVRLGKTDGVWTHLRHSADPRVRSFIINWLRPMGTDPKLIADEFERLAAVRSGSSESSSGESASTTPRDVVFQPELSTRRALVLALGTFEAEELSPVELDRLTNILLDSYRNDPDAGVHGAAEWTLRRWRRQEKLKAIDANLRQLKDRDNRRWYVNGQGQTLVVIEGPLEFQVGSPETDSERRVAGEPVRRVTIPRRRFAVATKEVTVEQFRRFIKANPQFKVDEETEKFLTQYSPNPDGPWLGPTWYTGAAYCNWLSKEEGVPEDQWCYLRNKDGAYAEGMTIPANALDRTGYRLPTEPEWEYACRAGAVTSRYYGVSVGLLGRYAWYLGNSEGIARPVGSLMPNDLGLFDMLGNVYEWCQDGASTALVEKTGVYSDLRVADEAILNTRPRMLRGGSYMVFARDVRSAYRNGEDPRYDGLYNGFRLARTCE